MAVPGQEIVDHDFRIPSPPQPLNFMDSLQRSPSSAQGCRPVKGELMKAGNSRVFAAPFQEILRKRLVAHPRLTADDSGPILRVVRSHVKDNIPADGTTRQNRPG